MPAMLPVWRFLTAIVGLPQQLGVDRQMRVQAGNTELPTRILKVTPRLPG
jgi:hypothetical protein